MNEHCEDCLVAYGDGELTQLEVHFSEVPQIAKQHKVIFQQWTQNPYATIDIKIKKLEYTLLEHFEEEYSIFQFCPECGKKIEWIDYFHRRIKNEH